MPERKVAAYVADDGTELSIEEVGFETVKEGWNEYRLEDGTTVRLKSIVGKIFRVLDDDLNPAFTKEGDPHLILRSTNIVLASE